MKLSSMQSLIEFERRRISSVAELTAGGDMNQINEIVNRYKSHNESFKQGMKSEGKKSHERSVESSNYSKNLLK